MKAPTCKECKSTGTIHIENEFVSRSFDMTCWVCQGTVFKGMSRDQVAWYLQNYKFFESLKSKSLKAGEITDMIGWAKFKLAISKACGRLGIPVYPAKFVSKSEFVRDLVRANLRNEFAEFERRLAAIPTVAVALAAKAA